MIDPRYLEWATVKEAAILELVNKHGSYVAAGEAIGRDEANVRRPMKRLMARAAMQGFSPDHSMLQTVPDPFVLKRRSQHFVDGLLKNEWVIAEPDKERRYELIKAAIEAASLEIPREAPVARLGLTNDKLCNNYTLTDSHLGMMVSKAISGSMEWNLQIAEEVLYGCFEQMILGAPNASVGIFSQLGDFLHTDALKALTPGHGHLLDVAGTYEQIVKAAVRVLRRIINLMLTKHDKVHVLLAEGNHDESGSCWLRVIFAALYENEPRVTVETSEVPYYVYEHGTVMLAYHHGHLKKKESLPLLFASMFPQVWGRTTKRYGNTGHFHHEVQVGEENGMKMIQHPTLAPNDNYATRHGYVSMNQARCTTYHSEFGEVGSNVVSPEMLLAA